MSSQAVLWAVFFVIILSMIALDLGVFSRRAHSPSAREAAILSVLWVLASLVFGAGIWYARGSEDGLAFFTGYILEKALSVDNLVIFLLILTATGVSPSYQPKILKWGVLGALVMRALFIVSGEALLHAFHWALYLFGGFIIWTGIRMLVDVGRKTDPGGLPLLRFVRKHAAPAGHGDGGAFLVRRNGVWRVTPLLLALGLVEVADLVFAIDSIPAILAVTDDPFLVYTSNAFAILGLRALYFLLTNVLDRLRYLKIGLAVVLTFVGFKMILRGLYEIPPAVALAAVASVLLLSVIASLLPAREGPASRRNQSSAADEDVCRPARDLQAGARSRRTREGDRSRG